MQKRLEKTGKKLENHYDVHHNKDCYNTIAETGQTDTRLDVHGQPI